MEYQQRHDSFVMPKTATGVIKELAEAGQLLNAKTWQRAALIYAITETMSVEDLAAQRIRGLEKAATIKTYRKVWEDAIHRGVAGVPKLGARVVLPDETFPALRTGTDGYQSVAGAKQTMSRIAAAHGPAVMIEALKADPELAQQVVPQVVAAEPTVARAVVDNSKANLAVIRATGQRNSGMHNPFREIRNEPPEPFARLLALLNVDAVDRETEVMERLFMKEFTGEFVWRPGERERLVEQLTLSLRRIENAVSIISFEVPATVPGS